MVFIFFEFQFSIDIEHFTGKPGYLLVANGAKKYENQRGRGCDGF